MKKSILKLELDDEKDKRKALKLVSTLPGIDSLAIDMKEKKLTVIGTVDPVNVVSKLRKFWAAHIIAVGPAVEPEKKEEAKKEEGKKEEEKKEEAKKEEEKKEETKKEEEEKKKKKEADAVVGMVMPLPPAYRQPYYNPMPYRPTYYNQATPMNPYHHQYANHSMEENPNACVIC